MNLLLGIDIGTSSCKIAVFNGDGEALAQSSAEYPLYYPEPGWVEQDPEEWWEAVCGAIKECLDKNAIDPAHIAGIGIAGQGWSAIPVDESGKVLARTPIWLDARAAETVGAMIGDVSEEELFKLSGNSFSPSYSTPKVLWLKENDPDLFARTDKFLQSNGFIGMKLTGRITSDKSQNYAWHFYDPVKGAYDHAMAERLGLPIDKFPDIVDCHEIIGTVTEGAAEETGLVPGIPVIAGGLDAACGTLGAGVIHNYETQLQGGQAGGVSICLDEPKMHPKLIFSPHVIPDRFLLQAGTVGGGGALRWFRENFGSNLTFAELTALAEGIPEGSEGVVFLPYLAGERSPIWNPKAKALFYGLSFKETKGHAVRAVLEGVVFSVHHNLLIAEQAGVDIAKLDIRAMGGAANSEMWIQMYADVTGCSIKVPSSDTATTLGAALLAGVAVGMYKDFDEAVERTVEVGREHDPDSERGKLYEPSFAQYMKLSQMMQQEMYK